MKNRHVSKPTRRDDIGVGRSDLADHEQPPARRDFREQCAAIVSVDLADPVDAPVVAVAVRAVLPLII